LACDIAREGIRRQHPEATAMEVEELLHHRLLAENQPDRLTVSSP
jgi:hypothetical protein